MRVAVYTLTRDRLDFTKFCFQTLWDRAGYPFDHYVLDNGSRDGTPAWLDANGSRFAAILKSEVNLGISRASNLLLDLILSQPAPPDVICKVDNDCAVESQGTLAALVRCFEDSGPFAARMILSPRVEGINHQPHRVRYEGRGGFKIGVVGIVGGLFHVVPAEVYARYRFPEDLPLARGQDDHFCGWAVKQGVLLGYVENVVVRHHLTTAGQAKADPAYFERKWREEKEAPR